jgi:membrane protein
MMGAALAFYAVFSIAPLLVILTGAAGLFFGDRGGKELLDALAGATGSLGAQAVISLVRGAASRPHSGLVATIIGVITLLIGASGVFGQLQESLNAIWKSPDPPRGGWSMTIRRRLLAFAMVGVILLLLLASMIATAVLASAGRVIGDALPGGAAAWQAVNALVSFAVIAFLFALTFKLLPDRRPSWRACLRGGLWTSVLFTAGQYALALYLGRTAVASTYGAAGSLIALLLWVYYSAQIMLFGAELTHAFTVAGSIPAEGPGADGEEQDRHRGEDVKVSRDLGQARALRHDRARRVDQMGQGHRVRKQP